MFIIELSGDPWGQRIKRRTAAYLRMRQPSRRWSTPSLANAPRCDICERDAPARNQHRHSARQNDRKQQRCSTSPSMQAVWIQNSCKFFCTKNAQCVYAHCVEHPPNTHWRGEPVTFLVVTRVSRRGNTIGGMASSAEKIRLEAQLSRGFHKCRQVFRKITATKLRFVHACCIHTHMDYKRTTGSGCLKPHKNSGRVARWRFKCFARDSFLPMQKGP